MILSPKYEYPSESGDVIHPSIQLKSSNNYILPKFKTRAVTWLTLQIIWVAEMCAVTTEGLGSFWVNSVAVRVWPRWPNWPPKLFAWPRF